MEKSLQFLVSIVALGVLLSCTSSATESPPSLDVLHFFDKETITANKLLEITLTIKINDPDLTESMSEEEKADREGQLTNSYRFDKAGRVTASTIGRVGSWVIYQYNEINQLVASGWQEKSNGTLELNPNKNFKELFETQLEYENRLANKRNIETPFLVTIVDNCMNLDGEYLIQDGKSDNGLPFSATAKRQKTTHHLFKSNKFQSPEYLDIHFEYLRQDQ